MEVQSEVLETLKCDQCGGYLSCAPVHLRHDGANLCGRCSRPEDAASFIRNNPYEQLAKLFKFPCRYAENGCTAKLLFSQQLPHEKACDFRHYTCPVTQPGTCEWVGPRTKLLDHCRRTHPALVLANPCTLQHDIAKACLKTYILAAFHVLFLVHAKVCTATRKIHHAVRCLGDPELVAMFSYKLKIETADGKLTKIGSVAPEECEVMPGDMSIGVDINSLLHVLGSLDSRIATIFNITIKKHPPLVDLKPSVRLSLLLPSSSTPTCTGCATPSIPTLTKLVHCGTLGWRCPACSPPKRPCMYRAQGCGHADHGAKRCKHQMLFCRYNRWCEVCGARVSERTAKEHRRLVHKEITRCAGETWRAGVDTGTCDGWQWCILSSAVGTLLCRYKLEHGAARLYVSSPLSTEHVYEYVCVAELSNPATGRALAKQLPQDHGIYDWAIKIDSYDYMAIRNNYLNIRINVFKKETVTP